MTPHSFSEYGTPLCPVSHTFWEYDDNDNKVPTVAPCGEEVDLIVTLSVSIGPDDIVMMSGVGESAVCSQWTVGCARGHILATSDGEETAEDFVWKEVFG